MTWVLPRTHVTLHEVSSERLLAQYWLFTDPADKEPIPLTAFVENRALELAQDALPDATSVLASMDILEWVTFFSFWGHPLTVCRFLVITLEEARTDTHLKEIALNLAEPILAHYGSLMPHFENQANTDPKFRRMLTGVWRHRMSDDVWQRLRAIQSKEPNPLSNMIPLEFGTDYMADKMKPEDRRQADKGRYSRDGSGEWQVTVRKLDSEGSTK